MDYNIKQVAERIKGLREILEISSKDMAAACDVSEKDYLASEQGEYDFSFTFLYHCARKFGVDITELISGSTPKLSCYAVVRQGKGLPIERRKGFTYEHLSYLFKKRKAETFKVTARYNKKEDNQDIPTSAHTGQEFNFVLKGALKFRIENHIELLEAGDAVIYDSSRPHGMIAANGKDCEFLAMVFDEPEGGKK